MKITAIVPWLVKIELSYWGEYLFVEVRTDAGLSGWGEITTTTKIANRAVAGMLRQLNGLLVGDDPRKIESLWHKTFRAFTYMGSRGAASHVVSGVDIALWDLLGKSRGLPIYEMLGGPVRDDISSTHIQIRASSRAAKASSRKSARFSIPAMTPSNSTPFRPMRAKPGTCMATSTVSFRRRASAKPPS
jgi:L-alanine-DL-glutamate epimerase-like enolase superfamily enzyme